PRQGCRGACAETAQAQADVHGGHRRAPRHRAAGRRAGGRLPVHRGRPARGGGREPQEPPGRGHGRRGAGVAGRRRIHGPPARRGAGQGPASVAERRQGGRRAGPAGPWPDQQAAARAQRAAQAPDRGRPPGCPGRGPGAVRPGRDQEMKASLLKKLEGLQDRYEELTALLGDAEGIDNQNQFRAYSKEYAEVEPVILAYRDFCKVQADLEGAREMLKDSDPELRAMAEEEVEQARAELETLEDRLQRMLLPRDPNDGRNVFLEIRAGTGGDEAAIFAGDLFRMYSRYAEKQG